MSVYHFFICFIVVFIEMLWIENSGKRSLWLDDDNDWCGKFVLLKVTVDFCRTVDASKLCSKTTSYMYNGVVCFLVKFESSQTIKSPLKHTVVTPSSIH